MKCLNWPRRVSCPRPHLVATLGPQAEAIQAGPNGLRAGSPGRGCETPDEQTALCVVFSPTEHYAQRRAAVPE